MWEWSHSKTVTHVLQMLSYFKTVFKTKRVLCCVTCCVTIMDSKVKYICFHRPTLVFFLSFIPFEVWKFSFAPRAFVYNISWSWQRETWNPRFMSKQINVRNFWFKSIYRPKQGKKHVEGYWSRSMENKMALSHFTDNKFGFSRFTRKKKFLHDQFFLLWLTTTAKELPCSIPSPFFRLLFLVLWKGNQVLCLEVEARHHLLLKQNHCHQRSCHRIQRAGLLQ